jgi:hypothetical protein
MSDSQEDAPPQRGLRGLRGTMVLRPNRDYQLTLPTGLSTRMYVTPACCAAALRSDRRQIVGRPKLECQPWNTHEYMRY